MTKLSDILDIDNLNKMIVEKYISVRTHGPLSIYNYTPATQWGNVWNHETLSCRGLICADEDVIGRPFPKFMNYGQTMLPKFALNTPPILTAKADGSLGISYFHDGRWNIATRGSFLSDQAIHANEHLEDYIDITNPNELGGQGTTTLFEIIYPENRVVVDYQGADELRFLALIDNETGADLFPNNIDWDVASVFPVVERYDAPDVQEAYNLATSGIFDDEEGLVACWPRPNAPSFRLKFKSAEYIRLHRILTGATPKTVWRYLATEDIKGRQALIDCVPDEFYTWLMIQEKHFTELADNTRTSLLEEYQLIKDKLPPGFTRRDFAELARHSKNTAQMFLLMDNRMDKFNENLWESIKPAGDFSGFKEDEE